MDEKPKRPPRKKPAAKRPAKKAVPAGSDPAAAEAAAAEGQTEAAPDVPTAPSPAGEPADAAPADVQAAAVSDADTAVIPPEEQTTALPAAEQTVALPPEQPTTVLPPLAASPSYAPLSKTAVVAPPRRERPWSWIIVGTVCAAIAALVLIWVLVSGGTSGDAFIGTWSRAATVGGGLTVEQDGDNLMVTWYDGQLNAQGPFAAALDDDQLSFQIPDSSGSGMVETTLATTDDPDVMQLTLGGAAELVTRATALSAATGTPTPAPLPASTPSPTASPSPSASGSPSPSPSTSGSPSPSPSPSGNDQAVINGVLAIQSLVLTWAGQHNNVFPAAGDVSATGAVGQGQTWPTNPYSGQPMKSGTTTGDYVYEQLQNGQSYSLMGYLANGFTTKVH